MSRAGRFLAFMLIAALLSACMPQGPFRVSPDLPPLANGQLAPNPLFDASKSRQCESISNNESCINFVEFDEFGNAFSRQQLNAGVSAASDTANKKGDVVVYIHGWHHSSRPGDEDVDNFQKLINRANLTGKGRKTVGMYLSWRGDSIDTDTPLVGFSSYVLTFWDRKSTAQNIGAGGGVSELLRKLSNIREENPESRLVIIGHSFGGAILYSSIYQTLGDQIRRDAKGGGGAKMLSVADLVVLVNPAFEAMRLKPLFDMARSYDYSAETRPSLVIVTTTADWATKTTFPLGRTFGTLFQYHPNHDYWNLDTTAVGQYEPFITHQLIVKECEPQDQQPSLLKALNPNRTYCIPARKGVDGLVDVPSMLWTRCEEPGDCEKVIGDKYLKRGAVEQGYMPYRFPIANIRTDVSVMKGHTDIWNDRMSNFLYELLSAVRDRPIVVPMIE
ncbi:hypothetical protein [Pseudomonas allokribbensis]|uniref:hypothetical protein n=1 Tax=Pseudomonas allokribbensis TaxID=2774460 RepID=UPI001788653C|nr:hypothetical protein [Pseudomonas allokribbensis]